MIRDGHKAHRALGALASSGVEMSEQDVYNKARRAPHEQFHEALNQLAMHRYAERTGERGAYRWKITDLGRERLEASHS